MAKIAITPKNPITPATTWRLGHPKGIGVEPNPIDGHRRRVA
jgi:hypothetical protein